MSLKAVITYQGFTESEHGPTGTEDLFFGVVRKFSGEHVTTFHPRRWNSDIPALMDMLIRQRIHDVILIGYSWGAGYACMRFAKLAPEWGIKVHLACLCDPVYRPTWMPAFLGANPLCLASITRASKIKVPESIRRVVWVRQRLSLPNGHDLVAKSPGTHIVPGRVLPYSHVSIDGSQEWYSLVRNELEFELNTQS